MNYYGAENEDNLPVGIKLFQVDAEEGENNVWITDLNETCPCYETLILPRFRYNISKAVNKRVKKITEKLNDFLVETIGATNRSMNIFFDSGIEVRGGKGHSLLLDIDKLATSVSFFANELR